MAYVYPLMKTHKRPHFDNFLDIPTRLVTSCAGNVLSKYIALTEHLIKQPVIEYCQSGHNEYLRDSKDYLQCLENIRDDLDFNEHTILCLDVEGLYPNSDREKVMLALKTALQHRGFNNLGISPILEIVKSCMSNIFIPFDDKIYQYESGIITGASNSVSLANAFLRYVDSYISKDVLTKMPMFKRFLDDIICICRTSDRDVIIQELRGVYQRFNLNITARYLDSSNYNPETNFQIEHLDVSHRWVDGKLETTLFVKETAKDSKMIHGESHHLRTLYRGIIVGEAIRMRRLCSTDEFYLQSLDILKDRCYRSKFPTKTIQKTMKEVKKWLGIDKRQHFLKDAPKREENKGIVWVS